MADVVINKFGQMQGWTSISVNMMGRDVEGITKIDSLASTLTSFPPIP